MPISPAQAESEAEELRRLYAELEEELLALITNRTARNIDSPRWAVDQLAASRAIQETIRAHTGRIEALGTERLGALVQQAYLTGVSGAGSEFGGIVGRSSLERASVTPAQALIREAAFNLQSTHLAVLRQVDDVYRQIIAEGSRTAIAGGETRKQAAQRILNQFADRGITGFVDGAGRNWSLDTYVEMATRTALGRAAVQGFIDTMIANGVDLVIVSNSPEPCPLCQPWEGKVLSLTGATTGMVTMAGGRQVSIAGTYAEAQRSGLQHPNCTHRLLRFIEGYTEPITDEPNPQRYEDRQRQRAIERNIRKWKRREAAALDEPAQAQAHAKVREWQAEMRRFIDETGRRRDYSREQIKAGKSGTATTPVPQVKPSEVVPVDRRLKKAARDEIAEALQAVDAVHTLPAVEGITPVRRVYVKSDNRLGDFNPNRNSRIGIRTELPEGMPAHYGMTFLHEMGHLIDYVVVGKEQAYGTLLSRFNTPPHWETFWSAVAQSRWFGVTHSIYSMLKSSGMERELIGQLEYLLHPAEMWARAYSQYIAGRSGSDLLARELLAIPTYGNLGNAMLGVQWEDDDFRNVGAAVEAVLRAEGLMQ